MKVDNKRIAAQAIHARGARAFFPGAMLMAAPIAVLGGFTSLATADIIYWDGTGTTWSPAANWSLASGATTPDPTAVPGATDDLVFNISSLNANQSIGLSGSAQAANSLTFNSTGTVTLGGGGNRDLSIGSGGITVAASAGASTIGSTSSNFNVFVRLMATQTWTNNSATQLRAVNAASAAPTGTTPVTLTVKNIGDGATTFSNQLNDGAGGAVLSVIVDSSGAGFANFAGGNFSGGIDIKRGSVATSAALGTGAVTLGAAAGGDALLVTTGAVTNNITVQTGSGLRALTSGTSSSTAADFQGNITLNRDVFIGSGSNSSRILKISGNISGNANVTFGRLTGFSSSPTVILTGDNSYTGTTTIESATVEVESLNRVVGGTATSSLGAPTALNGTIVMSAVADSTLRYVGTGEATDRVIEIAANRNANLEQAGTGLLKFEGAITHSGTGSRTLGLRGDTEGTGEISGVIENIGGGSTTSVSKTGGGTWRLSGLNTHTGINSVSGGVLEVTVLADGGIASSLGASGATSDRLAFGGSGPAATLRYVGTSNSSTNRHFNVGSAGAVFDASGLGTVSFTGTAMTHSSNTVARTITFTGSNTGANTMNISISNAGVSGLTSLVKSGDGTWVFSGANSYTGTTDINDGRLIVSGTGSLASPDVEVASGATLELGDDTSLSNTSLLTLNPGSTLDLAFATGNEQVDQLLIGGVLFNTPTVFNAGNNYQGYGSYFTSDGGGLEVIPEPASLGLVAMAGCGLLARRRRPRGTLSM